jgi:hypothetical protein
MAAKGKWAGSGQKLAAPDAGKLPMGDKKHVEMAKEALSPKGFRGHQVQLSPAERVKAEARVNAAAKRMGVGKGKK